MTELSVVPVRGKAARQYLEDLAHLRITVFREFPYLYDGDMGYERQYLKTYSDCEDSFFAVVLDGDQVVGVSTAIPMRHEESAFQQPLREAGWPIESICYFGESLLLPAYRKQGLGVRFFQLREAFAQSLPGCQYCMFSAVQRPAGHPLRPSDYEPLD
ncbi:MAG: GNAT family N-acetyltransferase, partial [Gammaproteobacteria bacterium]